MTKLERKKEGVNEETRNKEDDEIENDTKTKKAAVTEIETRKAIQSKMRRKQGRRQ